MRTKLRTLAVLVGAATLLIGTASVATAHNKHDSYGFQQVRRGIPAGAARFAVSSPTLKDRFPASDLANGFGCTGSNARPELAWSRVPAGTRSLAVTMYDPDAPTGSGFWHWLTWDIPAGARGLGVTPPVGTVTGTNDSGAAGYIGPCPPAGDIPHRYEITVYALDVPTLSLPATVTPAVAGFTMSTHIIGYGRLTATARR